MTMRLHFSLATLLLSTAVSCSGGRGAQPVAGLHGRNGGNEEDGGSSELSRTIAIIGIQGQFETVRLFEDEAITIISKRVFPIARAMTRGFTNDDCQQIFRTLEADTFSGKSLCCVYRVTTKTGKEGVLFVRIARNPQADLFWATCDIASSAAIISDIRSELRP